LVVNRSWAASVNQISLQGIFVFRVKNTRLVNNLSFEKYFWDVVDLRCKVILDVGAGKGATTVRVLEKMSSEEAGGIVVAVDVVRGSLALCKENVAKLPHRAQVELIAADSAYLPLRDESVDLVLSSRAIADMNSPPCRVVKVLAELYRVLGEGGRVVLSDECPITKQTQEDEVPSLMRRLAKAVSHLIGREHAHEVDPKDLEFIMRLVGFKEIELRTFKGESLTPQRIGRFVKNSMDIISHIDDSELRRALAHHVKRVREALEKKGGFLPPRYVLHARK